MRAIGEVIRPEGGADSVRPEVVPLEASLRWLEIRPDEAETIAETIQSAVAHTRARFSLVIDPRSVEDRVLKAKTEARLTEYTAAADTVDRIRYCLVAQELEGEEAQKVYETFMWSVQVHADMAAEQRPWAKNRAREKMMDLLLGLVEHEQEKADSRF